MLAWLASTEEPVPTMELKGNEVQDEQAGFSQELAAHLAQVKLESEERIFKLKDQIVRLHKEVEASNAQNRELNARLEGLKPSDLGE